MSSRVSIARVLSVVIACCAASLFPANLCSGQTPPNIVIILCDDLGYGDVHCLNPGGKIPTPQMDALAAAGMRFTDAHSPSAVCTPSRYGLLTGRYAWRSRLQQGVLGGLSPTLIEPERLTLAQMLQNHGYQTACIGKWHLGLDWMLLPGKQVTPLGIESREQVWNVDFSQPAARGPNDAGFERFFGISASLDMVPYTFLQDHRVTVLPTEDREFPMIAGVAGRQTRRGPAAPGFTPEDVLPTLTQQGVKFIEDASPGVRSGKPFFLYLPLTAPHTPVAPTPEWQQKSGLVAYADFVMQTDDCVGKVRAALQSQGLIDNTLMIVTSDNGFAPYAQQKELLAAGHNPSGPFRGAKADIYEGGHRVPLIASWPSRIPAGTHSDHTLCLTDLMATCAQLLQFPLPADAAEDSVSFLPVLTGEVHSVPRPPVIHHSVNGSFAIREGEWKLVLCPGSGGWSDPRPGDQSARSLPPVQLFNLANDLGEQHNLQAEFPDEVQRLQSSLMKLVAQGRSTPGPARANAVEVDIWKSQR